MDSHIGHSFGLNLLDVTLFAILLEKSIDLGPLTVAPSPGAGPRRHLGSQILAPEGAGAGPQACSGLWSRSCKCWCGIFMNWKGTYLALLKILL